MIASSRRFRPLLLRAATSVNRRGANASFFSTRPPTAKQPLARESMTDYWDQHSSAGSIEEMMLDSNASEFEEQERAEILSMLPQDLRGKRVLELAAGVGRFTGTLCERAGTVDAVDFVASFSQLNIEANGHHSNLRCLTEDVTTLELPAASYDVIFSNWLLMYLSDTEVEAFAHNALRWLSPGGVLFFRESCYRQSGDADRSFNPTNYRDPEEYTFMMRAAREQSSAVVGLPQTCNAVDVQTHGFVLEKVSTVQTYVQHKENAGQICWLWKKALRE